MAALFEALFIIQFFIVVGIALYKIYNLMHKGTLYPLEIALMLFITQVFFYSVGFITSIYYFDTSFLLILIELESYLMYFNIALLLGELFFLFLQEHTKKNEPNQAYYANGQRP